MYRNRKRKWKVGDHFEFLSCDNKSYNPPDFNLIVAINTEFATVKTLDANYTWEITVRNLDRDDVIYMTEDLIFAKRLEGM